METDSLKAVLLHEVGKMAGYVVRLVAVAHHIHVNVLRMRMSVAITHKAAIRFLPLL